MKKTSITWYGVYILQVTPYQVIEKKIKLQKNNIVYKLSCKKKKGIYKNYTCTTSSVQKKNMEDKAETKILRLLTYRKWLGMTW